jgi:hypothetical protein
MILLGGLGLIVTGSVATYVGRLALPAGISIVVGAAACLLAAIGRWPANLSWGSASVAFAISNQIRNQIDEELESAPVAAKPALERVRERVTSVQVEQTPKVAAAIAYDDAVERALRRAAPDAILRRNALWSRERADFWLVVNDREAHVETKYVGASTTFSGFSLDVLIDKLHHQGLLLVITNAREVGRARERVVARMGYRGTVVSWRDSGDDSQLAKAIDGLRSVVP